MQLFKTQDTAKKTQGTVSTGGLSNVKYAVS